MSELVNNENTFDGDARDLAESLFNNVNINSNFENRREISNDSFPSKSKMSFFNQKEIFMIKF